MDDGRVFRFLGIKQDWTVDVTARALLKFGVDTKALESDYDTLDTGAPVVVSEFGPINGARLPPYHRLDLRVTRQFRLGRGRLQTFLDLFNVYNRTNLRSYDYRLRGQPGQLRVERVAGEELLPLLPSIGVRWEF